RSQSASYTLPTYAHGSTRISAQRIMKTWCPPQSRKRAIDVVLMSIGGNDVGFSALAASFLTPNMAHLAPHSSVTGRSRRFGPQVGRAYLEVLDERMKAVKEALHDGFGVTAARVVQTSYEPIQYDETGSLCGGQPTLGMDVHPGLKISRQRLQETADFMRDFLTRLQYISGKKPPGCAGELPTAARARCTRVTDHTPEFSKRGLCARDPKHALADDIAMRVPRKPMNGDAFKPYSPAATLPYAHRWRLFRTPNDAFLTANSH